MGGGGHCPGQVGASGGRGAQGGWGGWAEAGDGPTGPEAQAPPSGGLNRARGARAEPPSGSRESDAGPGRGLAGSRARAHARTVTRPPPPHSPLGNGHSLAFPPLASVPPISPQEGSSTRPGRRGQRSCAGAEITELQTFLKLLPGLRMNLFAAREQHGPGQERPPGALRPVRRHRRRPVPAAALQAAPSHTISAGVQVPPCREHGRPAPGPERPRARRRPGPGARLCARRDENRPRLHRAACGRRPAASAAARHEETKLRGMRRRVTFSSQSTALIT